MTKTTKASFVLADFRLVSAESPELKRQVFTTSRELEYFSESELTTQTGYSKGEWWPGVVVKELIDNSLDACEQADVGPVIAVDFDGDSIRVTDNGPGIPGEVIHKIFNFSTRTSDKQAYVSPTRGAQGNALKTILAIPYVLSAERTGIIHIESQGLRHIVSVSTDHIARRPRIDYQSEQIVKTEGTSILLHGDSASSNRLAKEPHFLQKLIFDYSLFNPHANLVLRQDGQEQCFPATNAGWTKWRPSDPTSVHWYNLERLENLIASYVAAEGDGVRTRTVREFVSEFRGLSGTAKQKKVTAGLGLSRAYLHDLVDDRRLDREVLGQLLEKMRESSKAVKPEALGVLGRDHFRTRLTAPEDTDNTFRYHRAKGFDARGLPFVVEVAFAMTKDVLLRGLHIGLNWSVPLSNPVQQIKFALGDDADDYGLSALLARSRINIHHDPVCLAVHLICPRFTFTDRGKGSVNL